MLALWVILHHLTGQGGMLEGWARSLPYFLYAVIRGGYQAVTTFFVLSGFVLSRSYAETAWNRKSLLRYGMGRFARVYPVYALSLLMVAPFILQDGTPGKVPLVAAHGLLLQGWLGHLPVSWNTPAWTLSCEIFFYLAFPLLAVVAQGATWRMAIGIAAISCVLTRAMWAAGISDDIKPLVHLSDFLMGIAASRIYDLLRARRTGAGGSWFYLTGIVAGVVIIAYPGLLPPLVDLNSALRPLNAMLLLGFALGGGIVARALSLPAMVYLGKSSYAMYILHVPLLWWYLRWSRVPTALPYLAIVIGVSALVYRFIEEPANRWLRGRVQPPKSPSVPIPQRSAALP